MMTRLGLDIGTNSIGWCLFEGDRILDIGVRIFSDGRDPKSGASLAVDRRNARAMRRRRDRYLRRRSALLQALVDTGLMPADAKEARALVGYDPYLLRKRALDERLEPHVIGRALFHLNQRRGFKSNRKAERKSGDDKESGKISTGAKALDVAMEEAGARTYGEFLAARETKRVRMPIGVDGYDFYPERRHLEHEFDTIWEQQAPHHPSLFTEAARNRLRRIIFFQRPLKEPKVGGCTFFTAEPRLPKAHPLFQERRLYEEVNQLEVTQAGTSSRKLTLDQRDAIILKLKSAKTASFSNLARLLKLADGESFNKASENRTGLAGDEVFAAFSHKSCFGTRWAHFDANVQWSIIEAVAEEEDPTRLHEWLMTAHGVTTEQADAIGRIRLPEGHGRLGETASRLILTELKKDVVTYNEAVEVALGKSHSDFRDGEVLDFLPYYGELLSREIPPGTLDGKDDDETRWGKITNPTVHIGLNQLRRLLNAIIRVHGRPDQIVVELARELKLSEKDKARYNKELGENTKRAQARSQKLLENGQLDTGANRALLRLWEELNPDNPLDRRCPFCSGPIGMVALFSEETEIEHIIPYSRSFDDSVANKVISHRRCNREKGNRTPWEAWGHTDRWAIIADQALLLHSSKRWRFAPDAMDRLEKDGGFIARQLTDTQYLARMARTYLSSLYHDSAGVYVIPGRMTAMLRRLWGLNELLPDHNYVENPHSSAPKNRLDHRHHAIDAAVVGATTRGLLNKISRAASRAEKQNLDRLFDGLPTPWDGFREDLRDALARIVVSHKQDHGRKGKPPKGHDETAARLHNDTAYGLTGLTSGTGLPIVVHRVPLTSLKPADIENPERIPDPALRGALERVTRGHSGKDFEKALLDFSRSDPVFKGIRRVRVREGLKVIPVRDKSGVAYKGYKGDANARFDVWRLPDGKWTATVVSMFDAHRRDFVPERPHPAAKKIMSLRQNDLIAVEKDGASREIMRVVKFGAKGQITIAAHQEAGPLKERDAKPNDLDPFKYLSRTAGSLKNLKARQVRIDELGRIFDPGPR
ncbi:type II CRISPR RNA-guided endonuclease Cas9 [Altererythrobacter fulvus]|uniref:type II CRISPR RNA-guided endonuclease Cas9 n=1 Tax=Caenibius fulvus TaxID=2126012 RepID=UPI0030162305